MRIALDTMGGDHAPGPIVGGAVEAIQTHDSLEVILVGDEAQVRPALDEALQKITGDLSSCQQRLTLQHASQVIGMHEKPSVLRTKRDSSIARCWELMATRQAEAVVSAGNTGAVAAGGLFTKLFLKGVKRPGIAVVMPTMRGRCVLLDVGANTACKPEHLFQYGVIGRVYAQQIVGLQDPSIGLMSIGTEDGKGNELVRDASGLFRASHLKEKFYGNVEGRDLYQGTVEVIICDGFVGNVILKVSESMFDMIMKMTAGSVLGVLDAERAQAEAAIRKVVEQHHHEEFGGAPLLGVEGTCLICHGSSRERSIRNALLRAVQHHDTHLNELIVAELEKSPL